MSGAISLGIVFLANILMVWQCVRLYREMSVNAARRVMFSSYIYLPVVLLALLANKSIESRWIAAGGLTFQERATCLEFRERRLNG